MQTCGKSLHFQVDCQQKLLQEAVRQHSLHVSVSGHDARVLCKYNVCIWEEGGGGHGECGCGREGGMVNVVVEGGGGGGTGLASQKQNSGTSRDRMKVTAPLSPTTVQSTETVLTPLSDSS